MKRTLTAAAAGLAILAGGVATASPAAASDDVAVTINTIEGWSFEPGPDPTYQQASTGDMGGITDPIPCGGLADAQYTGIQQICRFNVPDAPSTVTYNSDPFYAISHNGYRYKVAGFTFTINNPDFYSNLSMEWDKNSGYSIDGMIPIDAKYYESDYTVGLEVSYYISNMISAWEENQAIDAAGNTVTEAVRTMVDEVKKEQGDISARSFRSTTGDNTYRVIAKHHTRLEKLATKVHNRGGALTVHAYGPDKGLALARARAVRAHLEEHLAKRGYVGPSPVHVLYVGDPEDKNGIHANVHWHKDGSPMSPIPGLDIVPVPIGAGASDS